MQSAGPRLGRPGERGGELVLRQGRMGGEAGVNISRCSSSPDSGTVGRQEPTRRLSPRGYALGVKPCHPARRSPTEEPGAMSSVAPEPVFENQYL